MISKTFNRYIWLLNLLLQEKQLTFDEISKRWKESNMGDNKPMPLRTFHNIVVPLKNCLVSKSNATHPKGTSTTSPILKY